MDGARWLPRSSKPLRDLNPLEGSTPLHSRHNFISEEWMDIIDISMEIHPEMTVYKNREEKRPRFEITRSISRGDKANESRICLDSHTGTHVDAYRHFLAQGDPISRISLDHFTGPCRVLDLTHLDNRITAEDLKEKQIKPHNIILLKTKNSFRKGKEFDFEFIYLEKTGAKYLADLNVKSVGIDALGIEREQPGGETHKILLSNGIPIIEGLVLKEAEEGDYTLYCLPLKLKGLDAAPARAILVREKNSRIK